MPVRESAADIIGTHARIATIRADETVAVAAQLMRDNNFGSLIIIGEPGEVAGIVTERDVVSRLVAGHADPQSTRVREIMSADVVWCSPTTPIAEANQMMVSHHIRHLPVIENGEPIGMISIRDILAHQLRVTDAMKGAAEDTARLMKCL